MTATRILFELGGGAATAASLLIRPVGLLLAILVGGWWGARRRTMKRTGAERETPKLGLLAPQAPWSDTVTKEQL